MSLFDSNPKKKWDVNHSKASMRDSATVRTHSRVAPAPISSGVSFRELPTPSLLQIIKCCQHYEEKCGGKYEATSLAARYLFDLSREIQDMIRQLRMSTVAREERIKHLEALVRDWCDVFGSPGEELMVNGITLSNNSPTAVASVLARQGKEISRLKKAMIEAARDHEVEMNKLKGAMRDQAAAAQRQYTLERQRLQDKLAGAKAEAEVAKVRATEQVEKALTEAESAVESKVGELLEDAVETATKSLKQERDRAIAVQEEAVAELQSTAKKAAVLESTLGEAKTETSSRAKDLEDRLRVVEAELEQTKARHAAQLEELRATKDEEMRVLSERVQADTDWKNIKEMGAERDFLRDRVSVLQEMVNRMQGVIVAAQGPRPAASPAPHAIDSSGKTVLASGRSVPQRSFVDPASWERISASNKARITRSTSSARRSKGDAASASTTSTARTAKPTGASSVAGKKTCCESCTASTSSACTGSRARTPCSVKGSCRCASRVIAWSIPAPVDHGWLK